MRLLLVVPSYYPEAYGGAERQATILAEALARRGVRTTILAPALRRDTPLEAATGFGAVRRLRVRDLPARGGRYLLSTLSWTVRTAALIRRGRRGFDLVYVFHGRLHVAGPLIGARLAGLPIFVKPGGGGLNFDYRSLRRKRFLYGRLVAAMKTRWTTGFVAVSREVEADLRGEGIGPERIHALPNGVELPSDEGLEAARDARSGRRFISTARLVHDKNVDVLVEALALAPGAELTLVGDGPEAGRLQAMAAALGVGERVRFLGALPAVTPELLAHDAFLTASLHEGQSNSLLEAFAAGVIPVAAPASGVADLIADGRNGFVVPAASGAAFAEALRGIMDLPEAERRAIGAAARTLAETRFGIDAVAGRLLELFETAVAARA